MHRCFRDSRQLDPPQVVQDASPRAAQAMRLRMHNNSQQKRERRISVASDRLALDVQSSQQPRHDQVGRVFCRGRCRDKDGRAADDWHLIGRAASV